MRYFTVTGFEKGDAIRIGKVGSGYGKKSERVSIMYGRLIARSANRYMHQGGRERERERKRERGRERSEREREEREKTTYDSDLCLSFTSFPLKKYAESKFRCEINCLTAVKMT